MFDKMDEWADNDELKQEYPTLGQYLSSILSNLTGDKKTDQTEII
jgi:hypothetical protein